MDVLLTNDDGIHSRGIEALATALKERGHKVHVVAPMLEQSGVGHSLTCFQAIRAARVARPGFQGTGIYGTPADCVKIALSSILERRPDLVMSGLNAGGNVGADILYSGTVGAAAEACNEELPSMAVSDDEREPVDLLAKARHAVTLAESLDWSALPRRRVLNLNYPKGLLSSCRGLKVCRQTSAVWRNTYLERRDPRGERYWWLLGEIPPESVLPGEDKDLLSKGFATLTPLVFDFSDEEGMRILSQASLPSPN